MRLSFPMQCALNSGPGGLPAASAIDGRGIAKGAYCFSIGGAARLTY